MPLGAGEAKRGKDEREPLADVSFCGWREMGQTRAEWFHLAYLTCFSKELISAAQSGTFLKDTCQEMKELKTETFERINFDV